MWRCEGREGKSLGFLCVSHYHRECHMRSSILQGGFGLKDAGLGETRNNHNFTTVFMSREGNS